MLPFDLTLIWVIALDFVQMGNLRSYTSSSSLGAGTIFKRFDASKLFVLVGQDVTERFHLALSLLFVLVVSAKSGSC